MKNLLPLFLALLIISSCKKKEGIVPVAGVTIDKGPAANVHMGSTLPLTATVLPENATSKEVAWDSSDPSIAIVARGLVTPLKVGEVNISATAGGVTATCKVTVLPPIVAVTGISLDPVTVNMVIAKTRTLKATVAPDNATDKAVVWTSDNENIATVSEGVITAIAEGTCTITAKSAADPSKTATCAVTVVAHEIPITGISVDPKTANIMVNETRQLTALIAPESATNKDLIWSTSDASVAEVSSIGLVTAKRLGIATITVAGVADRSKTATCAVTVTNDKVPVTGLTAAPADTIIAVNTSFQLRHKIEPATATNVNVTYESNDIAIATVSSSGLVTAGATGEATITVKSVAAPHKTASCQLTIRPRVGSITLSPDAVDIAVGQKRFLTATVMPADAVLKTVSWRSDDPAKATVSDAGEVTAVALGTVHIIATAMDGSNITGSSTIRVVTGVAGISLDHTELGIIIGETKTLVATIAPANATNKSVQWISDKENIATVSTTGVITARATGTCTITAKSIGYPSKTATCAVTVSAQPILVTDISVTPETANILVNETRQLTAALLPENATNKDVTWSTSDAAIAGVSTAGLVTAKSMGTATITATSVSNSAKTAACVITVTNREVAVTSLTAVPADTTLTAGASFQLRHEILPLNATNVNVSYVSGEPAKASVSETGLVTAGAAGQTTITVISAADPTKMGTCTVTVTSAEVLAQSIIVSPDSPTLLIGLRRQLTATVLPGNAANKTVTWSSADPAKATVSASGEVTALASRQVVIIATANDGSGITGQTTVTVLPRATSLSITPANPAVTIGQSLLLSATVLPAEAIQTVIWSSADPTKATINAIRGTVSGVGAGTVTLTATATDGSGITGTVTLTVLLPVSTASIIDLTVRAENSIMRFGNPGATTTLNYAPRSLGTTLSSVQLDIDASEGAVIKIGTTNFSSGQRVNCTRPVTFTVTEEGKSGSKEYTLIITPYHATSNPYGIYSLVHLQDIRNDLNASFKLMHDLTMPESFAGFPGISEYGAEGWLPIGDENNPFTGTLDGAGHKIDNLYAKRETLTHVGFFGKVGSGGTIKNLEVNTITEKDKGVFGVNRTGKQYAGILAGQNFGTIEDCHTTGTISSRALGPADTNAYAGGLAGAHEGGQIRRCYSTATAQGMTMDGPLDCFVGGLVGYNRAHISDCYATGDVYAFGLGTTESSAFSGGLVGDCPLGTVDRCYATGTIYAKSASTSGDNGAYAGGLLGHCNAQINNCYALGTVWVSGTYYKNVMMAGGGFVGRASRGSISNSYAIGNVFSNVGRWDYTYIGGFCGNYHTTFTNCYRNWDAETNAEKRLTTHPTVTPWDKGVSGISAEYFADMKTEAQKNKLNQGQTAVWGHAAGKNNDLPYLIGVGVGE